MPRNCRRSKAAAVRLYDTTIERALRKYHASPEQTTVGKTFSLDTLTKADKLEIAHVRDPVAVEPVILVTKTPNATPPQPLSTTATPKILSRHWHDPKAKKSAAVSPDRHIKHQEPKKSKNVESAKAPVDLRPVGVLRALPDCYGH
jgi:hypothetical protein